MTIFSRLNPFRHCPIREAEIRLDKIRLNHLDNTYNAMYFKHMQALTAEYSVWIAGQINDWKEHNGNPKVSTLTHSTSNSTNPFSPVQGIPDTRD